MGGGGAGVGAELDASEAAIIPAFFIACALPCFINTSLLKLPDETASVRLTLDIPSPPHSPPPPSSFPPFSAPSPSPPRTGVPPIVILYTDSTASSCYPIPPSSAPIPFPSVHSHLRDHNSTFWVWSFSYNVRPSYGSSSSGLGGSCPILIIQYTPRYRDPPSIGLLPFFLAVRFRLVDGRLGFKAGAHASLRLGQLCRRRCVHRDTT